MKSNFKSKNMDQWLGYEAGQYDGASKAFATVAAWMEEDVYLGIFDAAKYIEVLRKEAQTPFVSIVAGQDPETFEECKRALGFEAENY